MKIRIEKQTTLVNSKRALTFVREEIGSPIVIISDSRFINTQGAHVRKTTVEAMKIFAVEKINSKEIVSYVCTTCNEEVTKKDYILDECPFCSGKEERTWIDPAGGVHSINEDNPAAMYL